MNYKDSQEKIPEEFKVIANDFSKKGLSTGAIIGIAAGVLVIILAILFAE